MYFSSLMIRVVFFIVLAAVATCFGQGPAAADMTIDAATRSAVIADLATDLRANYVFAEVASKTAGMLEKNRADGKYDTITSGKAFAGAVFA